MKTRSIKSRFNNLQKKISFDKGYPGDKTGKDGEFTVRFIKGSGLFLFYKWNSKWYSSRLSQFKPRGTERNEPVVIRKGRQPTLSGEVAMDTSGKVNINRGGGEKKQVVQFDSTNTLDINEVKVNRTTTSSMTTDNAGTSDLAIVNTTGHSHIHIGTQGSAFDPFIRLSYELVGESPALKQWSLGMDNSDSDIFKMHYIASGTAPLTPSSTTSGGTIDSILELTSLGALSLASTLTIGSISSGTETDYLIKASDGTVKYRALPTAAITALNNATANELVTVGATTTELDAESSLTYTANNLLFSSADSRMGIMDGLGDDDGDDLDVHAGNADGANNAGGDLYLNAGRGTGTASGGRVKLTTSQSGGSSGSTLRGEVVVAEAGHTNLRVTHGDGYGGTFQSYNSDTDVNWAALTKDGLHSDQALTVDGDAGSVAIDDGGLTYATFTSSDSSLKLHEAGVDASGDYFKIACAAAGATTISTVDALSTNAHLTLAPDGQLILQSGTGINQGIKCDDSLKIAEQADATLDIAGYGQLWVHDTTHCDLMFTDDGGNDRELLSGMILGYTSLLNDAADTSYTVTDAYVTVDATTKITFVAPPSGNVEIFVSIYAKSTATRQLYFGLSDNATYNTLDATHEHEVWIGDETDENTLNHQWVITGLTSGSSYTYFLGAKADQSGRLSLHWGGDTSGEYAPFIMKATALPATLYEG